MKDASLDRQPKIQSFLVREILRWILVQTNNNCRSQITILTNSPCQLRLLAGRIKFKTEVCTCSQFSTEAMQWIKEVEIVDSVDDLKVSPSTRGISMPNFEVLDARFASAFEQNHPWFFTQKKNLSERTKGPETGPFPSRKTDCFPDLRVLPGHRSQWFCRELCRPVHHCSSKWWYSGIRFRMGRTFIVNEKIPFDDILEGLYNSETSLGNSWPYCNCLPWTFIGRKLDLIITDWRRRCKEVLSRIYELIFSKSDTEIMKETPWSRIRGQNSVNKEFLEIVGNGKPTGSVLKETTAVSAPTLICGLKKWNNRIRLRVLSCSRMREMRASRSQTNWLRIWTSMSRKPQRCSSKNFRWDWMRVIFASRSKAKAKPRRREPAGSSPRTVPIGKRTWTDVEPGEYSLSEFEVSKKLIRLLRHVNLPRKNDGAIEFWRNKYNLQKHFLYLSSLVWR